MRERESFSLLSDEVVQSILYNNLNETLPSSRIYLISGSSYFPVNLKRMHIIGHPRYQIEFCGNITIIYTRNIITIRVSLRRDICYKECLRTAVRLIVTCYDSPRTGNCEHTLVRMINAHERSRMRVEEKVSERQAESKKLRTRPLGEHGRVRRQCCFVVHDRRHTRAPN